MHVCCVKNFIRVSKKSQKCRKFVIKIIIDQTNFHGVLKVAKKPIFTQDFKEELLASIVFLSKGLLEIF